MYILINKQIIFAHLLFYYKFITFQLSRLARIGSPDSGFEKGRNTNLQK